MGDLTIGMNSQMDTTVVSNQFIDHYMPSANGEYVKIYLYILRSVNHHASTFSIEEMAKKFDYTVSYILNALKSWESEGVLRLGFDENHTLHHIDFLDLKPEDPTPEQAPDKKANAASAGPKTAQARAALQPAGTDPAEDALYEKRPYTLDDKKRLTNDKNFTSAKFVTQTYFGKPLGPTQLESLMFIYDGLGFDNDLIDCLVEYCVSKGRRSMRYVEATAIAWAKQGITTAALARERIASFDRLSVAIMQEFGISGRSLVAEERAYIDKWTREYQMSETLVKEACRRTRKATGRGSFEYADSILASWHKAGISTMDAVAKADSAYRSQNPAPAGQTKKTARNVPFPQREYDMDALERQLLQTGKPAAG